MKSARILRLIESFCLFALIGTARHIPAQSPTKAKPSPSILDWKTVETRKPVTDRLPSDYRVGAVYRLKQDVVVECGGTSSRVSKYWVSVYETDSIDSVREELRDPQAAKEREIQLLQSLGPVFFWEKRMIRNRPETRTILAKGTLVRFQQIWLDKNFEIGVTIHPYVEVLDGSLQGKWIDVHFISEREEGLHPDVPAYCNLNAEYLELATPAAIPGPSTNARKQR